MPFSRSQIIQIEEAAKKAFDIHDNLDALDLPGDLDGESKTARYKFWRKRELSGLVGFDSYNDCDTRRDYLKVKGHFQKLAGNKAGAENTRQRDEWGSDATHTVACEALRQLRAAMKTAGLSENYIKKIAAAKFRGESDLRQLTDGQLWHLCYTIRNRANAKLDRENPGRKGASHPHNRDKKQRAERLAKKSAPESSEIDEQDEMPF